MSVASKNPFALLDEEAGNAEAAPAGEKGSDKPKADAAQAKGNQKGKGGPASRGGRYYQRGGGAKTGGREDQAEDAPAEGEAKRNGETRGRGRGRGHGDRGGRGGGGGRGRQFDKHSQTGKTDSEKKFHQGWGGDEGNSELKAEEAADKDAQTEIKTGGEDSWGPAAVDDGWGAPSGDAAPAPAEGENKEAAQGGERRYREREEEEDNTLTLEQYLAQKKEKEAPKLEVRKVEDSDWKDAVPLTKNEEDAYFVGKTKNAPKPKTKKEEKVYIEIDGRFDRPARGGRGGRGGDRGGDRGGRGRGDRGDRGDRGGGRGRGGGREYQSTNGHSTQVDVDDQSAFPSLS